jgi:class 3 adenylate cyclase
MSSRIVIDQTSRNVICSVVFVDLVEYTRKSVASQMAIKDRFTALLAAALKDIPVNDRIVLDTGDGAAMSFLGDPEDALFVGMTLRDALKGPDHNLAGAATFVAGEVTAIRVGVNLGPVRLVKDINGHPNIVGDGINVAQRIMSFADPGQILASRSYFDVVSCLSDEYAGLFSYEGSRTDKHVREHEVYIVGESKSVFEHVKTGMEQRAAQTQPRLRARAARSEAGAAAVRSWQAATRAANEFLRDRKKVMIAGAVLGAVAVLLAALLMVGKPVAPALEVAATPHAADAGKPEARPAAPATPATPAAPVAAPEAKGPGERPVAAAALPRATEPKHETGKTPPARAATPPGSVDLAIAPWGEIFVDGRSRGLSPPIKHLKLAPGRYRIEIRNTTFAPHEAVVQVKAGEHVTVRHLFK